MQQYTCRQGQPTETVANYTKVRNVSPTDPMATSFILAVTRTPRPPIFAATNWIQVRNPFSVKQEYMKQTQSVRDYHVPVER